MLSNLQVVLCKVETTYGVDPVPVVGTDAILAGAVSVALKGEPVKRNALSASLSPWPAGKPVMGLTEVKLTCELKGSGVGAGTTPPEIAPLLRACRMGQTIGANYVDYDPISTGFASVTIYAYLDGMRHIISGCMGEWDANLEAGKNGEIAFTLLGLSQLPTDVALASGAVYDSTLPPLVESLAFSIGGYAPIAKKLQIKYPTGVQPRESIQAAGGLIGGQITAVEEVVGSMDPEAVTRATHEFWLRMQDATPGALTATLGNTAGNRLIITAPAVTYDPFAWGDRNGLRTYEVPLRFARSAGDDEIRLRFN